MFTVRLPGVNVGGGVGGTSFVTGAGWGLEPSDGLLDVGVVGFDAPFEYVLDDEDDFEPDEDDDDDFDPDEKLPRPAAGAAAIRNTATTSSATLRIRGLR